jgi:hypothetical protein
MLVSKQVLPVVASVVDSAVGDTVVCAIVDVVNGTAKIFTLKTTMYI